MPFVVNPFTGKLDANGPSLAGFVPYTGATTDVDLGLHYLKATNATYGTAYLGYYNTNGASIAQMHGAAGSPILRLVCADNQRSGSAALDFDVSGLGYGSLGGGSAYSGQNLLTLEGQGATYNIWSGAYSGSATFTVDSSGNVVGNTYNTVNPSNWALTGVGASVDFLSVDSDSYTFSGGSFVYLDGGSLGRVVQADSYLGTVAQQMWIWSSGNSRWESDQNFNTTGTGTFGDIGVTVNPSLIVNEGVALGGSGGGFEYRSTSYLGTSPYRREFYFERGSGYFLVGGEDGSSNSLTSDLFFFADTLRGESTAGNPANIITGGLVGAKQGFLGIRQQDNIGLNIGAFSAYDNGSGQTTDYFNVLDGSFNRNFYVDKDCNVGTIGNVVGSFLQAHKAYTGADTLMQTWLVDGIAEWAVYMGPEATPNLYIGSTFLGHDFFWRANWNEAGRAVNTFHTASGADQVIVAALGNTGQSNNLIEARLWDGATETTVMSVGPTGTGAFGTLSLSSGSITDSSGAISFGDENLTTTGDIYSGSQYQASLPSLPWTVDGSWQIASGFPTISRFANDAFGSGSIYTKARGTVSSPSSVSAGDVIGIIQMRGYAGNYNFPTVAFRGKARAVAAGIAEGQYEFAAVNSAGATVTLATLDPTSGYSSTYPITTTVLGTFTGGTKVDADSVKSYWGVANDAYAQFIGTQFQIVSDAVTSTDSLLLRGGTNGILFNVGATEYASILAATTTIKNDFIFSGAGSGFPHGGIWGYNQMAEITISASGIANKVQIITPFTTNGNSNLTTPDESTGDITVTKTGEYAVICTLSADSVAGGGGKFGFGVFINNGATQFQNIHAHVDYAGGTGESKSITLQGHASLTAGDTVEIWAWNETNTNNIVIDDINLNVFMLGG